MLTILLMFLITTLRDAFVVSAACLQYEICMICNLALYECHMVSERLLHANHMQQTMCQWMIIELCAFWFV